MGIAHLLNQNNFFFQKSKSENLETMKIVTWNVNGIRSFDGKWKEVLENLKADIICVQETKVTRKCKFFTKRTLKS